MDRQTARDTIRDNWRQIITTYTGTAKRKVAGKETYICPFCGHGSGGDGMTGNPKSPGQIRCFGPCGFSGDIIDFIQQVNNTDYDKALKEAAGILGITIDPYRVPAAQDFKDDTPADIGRGAASTRQGSTEAQAPATGNKNPAAGTKAPETDPQDAIADYSAYYAECARRIDTPAAASYLEARGISKATAVLYNLGFDPEWISPATVARMRAEGKTWRPEPTPRLIVPITANHYIARDTRASADREAAARKGDPDFRDYRKMNETGGGKIGFFNMQAITEAESVFVVEGVFDALAIIEAGGAAVAINSTSNAERFINDYKEAGSRAPLIICLDNDAAGRKAAGIMREGAERLQIGYVMADITGPEYKDANERIQADRAGLVTAIADAKEKARQAAEQAEKAANMDVLTAFFEKIQTDAYKPYETGLNFFDNLLGGGALRQTVILIMAAPGSGKTTLTQQVAEEMARRGKPCIYLNLEMSREQMLAKAISARAAVKGKPRITATDVLQGYKWTAEQRQTVIETLEDYRKSIFPFMTYNPDGITGDLEQLTAYLTDQGEKAKQEGTTAPAVVLDYLHLVSSAKGLDEKEVIKQTINEIKQYCLKYDTFGIVVSATNRLSNESGRISLGSGRDSSNIEFGGDALISLNFYEIDNGSVKANDPEAVAILQRQPFRHMILRVLKARLYQVGRESKVYFHAATNRFYGENDFLPVYDGEIALPFNENPAKDAGKDNEQDSKGKKGTKDGRR